MTPLAWLSDVTDAITTANNYTDTQTAEINALISPNASPTNQLVDTNSMTESIQNLTANHVYYDTTEDNFPTRADIVAATTFYDDTGAEYTPVNNDYAIVNADEGAPDPFTGGQTLWLFGEGEFDYDYALNQPPFTSAQEAAINSGITSALVTTFNAKANTASPAFTGTPTAPTAATTVNSGAIATTAYVKNVLGSSPALAGTPTAPTATATVNNTQIATTAWVRNHLATPGLTLKSVTLLSDPQAETPPMSSNGTLIATTAWVRNLLGASPALAGTPTAPTAATTTNNTQIATTAFVKNAIEGSGRFYINDEGILVFTYGG